MSSLSLTAASPQDFPRGYELYASNTEQFAQPIAKGEGTRGTTTINFPRQSARFLKIVQTGTSPDAFWSISEIAAFDSASTPDGVGALPAPRTVVASGLQDPIGITLDDAGNIYISDRGSSHQVKVFDARGHFLRAIGHAEKPAPGPYDASHMNNPNGVTLDDKGRLWVAETDYTPKRLSVWNAQTGALVDAFYGPSQYGGGGELDPRDASLFYYGGDRGSQAWKLDWKSGQSRLIDVLSRTDTGLKMDVNPPQSAIYLKGRKYMTSVYSSNGTQGNPLGAMWMPQNGVAQPRCAFGRASDWSALPKPFMHDSNNFSVRWTGQVVAPQSGDYRFSTVADDGTRLWVNGQQLVDEWHVEGPTEHAGTVHLEAGQRADIKLEYYQGDGGASAQLFWQGPGVERALVPASALFPTPKATKPGGLTASYYDGANFGTLVKTQTDAQINFDWNNVTPSPFVTPISAAFAARVPKLGANEIAMFVWSDLNGDGQMQPEEVQIISSGENGAGGVGGVTLMPDLSWIAHRVGGHTIRYAPVRFTPAGVPVYDLSKGEVLSQGAQAPPTTGGDQVLHDPQSGWTVLTTAPKPFLPYGFGGVQNGELKWTFPSMWPGLHAGHDAPVQEPGMVTASTRLLGPMFQPKGSDAGPMWGINSDRGQLYIFTADGMFVSTLFKDSATASFNAPTAKRGMLVNDLSLQGEDFFPTLSSTPQGIYIQGEAGSLFSVEGLENVHRLPDQTLDISAGQLAAVQELAVQAEAARQAKNAATQRPLTLSIRAKAPVVDGKLDEWPTDSFVTIDVRRVSTGGWPPSYTDSPTQAALAVAGDRLYGAFRTDTPNLLQNRPESLQNLFKTGGALDVQLGNVEGGQRLLITRVGDKTLAVLYRPHDPQVGGQPWKFTSNIGALKTTVIDRVQDVSDQVTLASNGGDFEFSVPLALLKMSPQAGQSISGDIGVLRGDGVQTLQRVYWHNKATGLVSDLASEAELTPQLWGQMQFKATP